MKKYWVKLVHRLAVKLVGVFRFRKPSAIIGRLDSVYLLRWYLIPRNRLFNIYLHKFCQSDNNILHDHPWVNLSLILDGEYTEHTIQSGGVHRRVKRSVGCLKLRLPWQAHRIEISEPCWTLFLTGPKVRNWGFHCPFKGWVSWQDFTTADGREVGKGCD